MTSHKQPEVHGDFRPEEFSKDFIGRVAYAIFHYRKALLIAGIVITVVLSSTRVVPLLV